MATIQPGIDVGSFAFFSAVSRLAYSVRRSIPLNLFASSPNRAPILILGNPIYGKKVIFPSDIFPIAALVPATVHVLVGLATRLCFG